MAKAKEAAKAQAETTEAAEVSLLDQIVQEGRFGNEVRISLSGN